MIKSQAATDCVWLQEDETVFNRYTVDKSHYFLVFFHTQNYVEIQAGRIGTSKFRNWVII